MELERGAPARRDQPVFGAPVLAELELRAPVHGETRCKFSPSIAPLNRAAHAARGCGAQTQPQRAEVFGEVAEHGGRDARAPVYVN